MKRKQESEMDEYMHVFEGQSCFSKNNLNWYQSLKIDNLEISKTSGQPTWQLNYKTVLILTYNTLVIFWDPLNSGSHPAHCFPGPYPCIKKTLVLSQERKTPPPPSCWAHSSLCWKQFREPAISQKYPYGFRLQWAYSSKQLLKK